MMNKKTILSRISPKEISGANGKFLPKPQYERNLYWVWGEFRPPSPESSVRIFSNRHRQLLRTPLYYSIVVSLIIGGSGRIRTSEAISDLPHFKCGALVHSATLPTT